jgi:putative transposase
MGVPQKETSMTTYTALYYHLVWSTKGREPIILDIHQEKLFSYIAGVIKSKETTAIQVGGMPDHIHILVQANSNLNLADLVKTIKIASGKWLRQHLPNQENFTWQSGYGAFTVSKSQTDIIKNYIKNQKEHHKSRSYDEEWMAFLQNHAINFNPKYALG